MTLQIRMTVLSLTVVIALYGVLAVTNLLRRVGVGEPLAEHNQVFRGVAFFLLGLLCWAWSQRKFVGRGRKSLMLILWGGLGGALSGDVAYLVMLLWEHFEYGRFRLLQILDASAVWVFVPIASGTWLLGILCLIWFESVRACIPSQSNLRQTSAIAP